MVVSPTERLRSEVGARSRYPARLQDAVLMFRSVRFCQKRGVPSSVLCAPLRLPRTSLLNISFRRGGGNSIRIRSDDLFEQQQQPDIHERVSSRRWDSPSDGTQVSCPLRFCVRTE